MKHIFIINPAAGQHNATNEILEKLQKLNNTVDYQYYETTGREDAMKYVSSWLAANTDTAVRFYACGGDGTLNEVVRGVLNTPCNRDIVEVTNYPNGSGNDYIKYYGDMSAKAAFSNLTDIDSWGSEWVDVLEVEPCDAAATQAGTYYSINVLNFGFDADVCYFMNDIRRIPILNHNVYTTCVIKALFTSMHNQREIIVDDQPFFSGDMLLCTASNGRYVGGTYKCSPRSLNNDGLIEVCMVYSIGVMRFAKLEKVYRRGEHLDIPDVDKTMKYCRAKKIEVKSDKPFNLCIDGENLVGKHFRMTNRHNAIRFAHPTMQ